MSAKICIKRCISLIVLVFLLGIPLFAQEGDWYYNKPIKKITFSGLKTVTLADVDSVTTPFKGQRFTDEVWMDILNRMYAFDYFDDITPELEPADTDFSQVIIHFTVVEKPLIHSISFKGNSELHSSELREAITLKKGDIFVSTKVLVDERKIRDTYLEKGFTSIKVSSEYEETEKGIDITYTISEGRATVVSEIRFEGYENFTTKTLKSQLSLKEAGLFNKGAFKESALEQDRQTLALYYRDRGFIDAEVSEVRRDISYNEAKNHDEMILTFVIREGSKYTFGGITINGNTLFSEKELMSLVTVKPGSDFNITKYQNSLMAIQDLYYENGYTSNSFIPQEDRNAVNRVITCSLTIVERPRSHIENIIVRGNTKTKEYVITRELPMEPGDIFSKAKLINGLRNLYNTQYFSAIEPEFAQGSEDNLMDLIINVEEGQTHNLEFGITFSGVAAANEFPLSVFIKNNNTNVGGRGKSISESLTLSNTTQSLGVGYGNAWMFNKPITFNAGLDIAHTHDTTVQEMFFSEGLNTSDIYMDYQKYSVTGSLSLGRRWTPNAGIVSLTGGISSDVIHNSFDSDLYSPTDSSILQNSKKVGLANTLWTQISFDDRDVYYDPFKGWFISQRLSYSGLLPKVESDYYFRTDTILEGYLPICSIPVFENWDFKLTLAGFSTLSTLTPCFNKDISFGNQLYIDGMFNGRGWNTLLSKRGQVMWSNTLELRSPIVPGIIALDFYGDAVVVKDTFKDFFTTMSGNDYYYSFGPGIRFCLPQFPIRLLFANTFQITDSGFKWKDKGAFTLSFNIANR